MRYDEPRLVRTGLPITHCRSIPNPPSSPGRHRRDLELRLRPQFWTLLAHGDLIKVESATVPKGTYIAYRKLLRLKTKASTLRIANLQAVLENTLRNFSALTRGATIRIYPQ